MLAWQSPWFSDSDLFTTCNADRYSLLQPVHLNITASRNKKTVEPQYSMNATTGDYNVTAVRQQLGAVLRANKAEGDNLAISVDEMKEAILKMRNLTEAFERLSEEEVKNPSPEVLELRRLARPYRENCHWTGGVVYAAHFSLCPDCPPTKDANLLVPNSRMGAIFRETIQETNLPALAVQAVKTTRQRYAYYNAMERFTMAENASLTYLEEVLHPRAFHGYWAGVAIITAHMLLFIFLLHSFLDTQFSFFGKCMAHHGPDLRERSLRSYSSASKLETRHIHCDSSCCEFRVLGDGTGAGAEPDDEERKRLGESDGKAEARQSERTEDGKICNWKGRAASCCRAKGMKR